ncbi:MAG TPA: CPBP family intramembrane metalloprotease [Firmicutes bacterium]|nr:CPBP family intramembrane metalloprotease [Bacillota bacterium]
MARTRSTFWIIAGIFILSMLILPLVTRFITERILLWAKPELEVQELGGWVLISSLLIQELSLILGSLWGLGVLALPPYRGVGHPKGQSFLKMGIGYGLLFTVVNLAVVRLTLEFLYRITYRLTGSTQMVTEWLNREQQMSARLVDLSLPLPQLVAIVCLVVFIVPWAEELFFRGLVFGSIRQRYGSVVAKVTSGLLFAFAHMYIINFPSVLVLGILLASIYERTQSLVPPVVAHATYNGVAVALLILHSFIGV